MATADRTQRRPSLTPYLSPSHHHDQNVRQRARSLNTQAERKSILRNSASGSGGGGPALRAPEHLPPPPSILRSSSSGSSRHRSRPNPYHKRRVRFADQHCPVDEPNCITSSASRRASGHRNEHVRKTGRSSRITGGSSSYVKESRAPFYPNTCFSPPPIPPGRYDDDKSDFEETPIGCFRLFPPRCRVRAGAKAPTADDSNDEPEQDYQAFDSPPPSPLPPVPLVGRSQSADPLYYTTLSEKLTARWGVFKLNMRFSMFRAQGRVKNGMACVRGMVR